MILEAGVDLACAKRKPRMLAPQKRTWLKEQLTRLREPGMVLLNPQAVGAIAAMVFSKGPDRGNRMVEDPRAINQLCEWVPAPMVSPEKIVQLCAGAIAFFTLNLRQGHWK